MSVEQSHDHLDWMLKNLPAAPAWNEWQQMTGELPPDFDALPSANFLPDPFTFHNGSPVDMPAEWPARRAEIRQLFEGYVTGSLPPKPRIDRIVPVEETKGDGYVTKVVRLEYGPESRISSEVTLTLPAGSGPFPVLLGGGGGWKTPLIRRGYAACEFPTSVDQSTDLPELYPDHDFATMGQRAWTARVVIDYLETLPEIDTSRIAITGYSRGGKMATIATAFDDRIAAVIAGSTGVGGVLPWRLSGQHGMGEGIESTTRMFPLWFAPQLRFFSGREDRLPVDANLLVALIAPRACLMEYGLNDEVSNVWGDEQCYHSALKVYQALNQPDRLGDPEISLKYATLFPDDVNYVIGQSDFRKDWFFQQVPHNEDPNARAAPYFGVRGNGRTTPFSIAFDLPDAPHGRATLRLAICGSGARSIEVRINDQPAGEVNRLIGDGAITRHSIQGMWQERDLSFDASLMKKGSNVLKLIVPAGPVNNGIIYDYIRLELDESAAETASATP